MLLSAPFNHYIKPGVYILDCWCKLDITLTSPKLYAHRNIQDPWTYRSYR